MSEKDYEMFKDYSEKIFNLVINETIINNEDFLTIKNVYNITKLLKSYNVKEWYLKTYKTDACGEDILNNITFYDILKGLKTHKDIYEVICGNTMLGDSIVRERIFEKLAEILQVDYDYIFNLWLE